MAALPTPPPAEAPLSSPERSPCIAVAYSGGRDSTALLHATLSAVRDSSLTVAALHVHHGLSAHADEWLDHCQAQCSKWQRRGLTVVFDVTRLSEPPARGESVEAWARAARYLALASMAQHHGASMVLLAHHRADQAETLLLQALRGAGVAGLAGMPKNIERAGLVWSRPWLGVPSSAVDAYMRRHRLAHITDDSNSDERFARNCIRASVMPALRASFPQAEAALADCAAWAQEAHACLAELADIDLARIASAEGLDSTAWLGLSPPRRSNALRAWLMQTTGRAAPASLVKRLMLELPGANAASWPLAVGALRVYRGRLQHLKGTAAAASAREEPRISTLRVVRAGTYALPGWGGKLQVARVKEGGVPMAWLAHLELKERQGREQFQAALGRPARSLKKQFQAAGVPAVDRRGPLIFSGGQLLFVPGLGLDVRVLALPGQAQVSLQWLAFAGGEHAASD